MNSQVFAELGKQYRALSIEPSTELLAQRRSVASRKVEELDESDCPSLTRIALGLGSSAERESLAASFDDKDAGFSLEPGDKELVLLATAIVSEAIENATAEAPLLALLLHTLTLSGRRTLPYDAGTFARASAFLASSQRRPALAPMPALKARKPPKEDLDAAEQAVRHNNVGVLWPPLRKVLEQAFSGGDGLSREVAAQLGQLGVSQRRLAEQLDIQWWAMAQWSVDARVAFSTLSDPEAIIRATKELSEIVTESKLGYFAAPAVIAQAAARKLESGGGKITIAEAAVATPQAWRSSWLGAEIRPETAVFTPVLTALTLAAEAQDEADWKPRFDRLMSLPHETSLTLLELANQLHLELQVRKLAIK